MAMNNRGAVSIKTVLVLVILVLVGVLGVLGMNTVKTLMGSAAAGVEPKNVVAKPEAATENGREEQQAIISWTSEKPAMSIVEYGTTPASLLLRAAEADQTTSHSVKLAPLKANTSYYFRFRIGEEVFDNNGIPYSFKTKGGGEAVANTVSPVLATPTVAPSGGCNRSTDYNKDGVTNSLDYVQCMSGNKVSPAASSSGSSCQPGKDFDGNGVVNSLDMIKCLQNKK